MAFLTDSDYQTQIKDAALQQVTSGNQGIIDQCELMAQQEVESYLNQRFDVADIFSQTGEDRSAIIVMYMVDITLYHLHSRITPRNIPQVREDRYNTAIMWLNKVAKGELTPRLPRLTDEDEVTKVRSSFSSNTKFNHQW
jgi:phage gp36-like protein